MTAIVIGGGHVGHEVATRLLAREDVVVVDQRHPLHEIATDGRLRFVERDAVTLSDVDAVLREVAPGRDPAEDKLVCAVGTYSRASPLDDPCGFEREFNLNFFGNVVPIKALLPGMLRRGACRIVVLLSTSGHHAPASLTAHAPSKWALEGFGGSLDADTRGTGIAVDAIIPTTLENVRSEVFSSTARSATHRAALHPPTPRRVVDPAVH